MNEMPLLRLDFVVFALGVSSVIALVGGIWWGGR
jgi:hypothetical protein